MLAYWKRIELPSNFETPILYYLECKDYLTKIHETALDLTAIADDELP